MRSMPSIPCIFMASSLDVKNVAAFQFLEFVYVLFAAAPPVILLPAKLHSPMQAFSVISSVIPHLQSQS